MCVAAVAKTQEALRKSVLDFKKKWAHRSFMKAAKASEEEANASKDEAGTSNDEATAPKKIVTAPKPKVYGTRNEETD